MNRICWNFPIQPSLIIDQELKRGVKQNALTSLFTFHSNLSLNSSSVHEPMALGGLVSVSVTKLRLQTVSTWLSTISDVWCSPPFLKACIYFSPLLPSFPLTAKCSGLQIAGGWRICVAVLPRRIEEPSSHPLRMTPAVLDPTPLTRFINGVNHFTYLTLHTHFQHYDRQLFIALLCVCACVCVYRTIGGYWGVMLRSILSVVFLYVIWKSHGGFKDRLTHRTTTMIEQTNTQYHNKNTGHTKYNNWQHNISLICSHVCDHH